MASASSSGNSLTRELRKLVAFGSGVGIEIRNKELEVAVVRVRASRVEVLGRLSIAGYGERPAAEWGAEYSALLKTAGMAHLSATVLLPRRDVIVRQLAFPGVLAKDMESAIRFQLDSLHPYGDEEICWGWSPLAYGWVMVGLARRSVVNRYVELFNAAGIAVSSFTFSAGAVHAAVRVSGTPSAEFVAFSQNASGGVEIYGESAARPVFSAEFNLPPQRAAILGLSELRLPPETSPVPLEQALPKPRVNPVENDLSRNAMPYAAALAGACPMLAPSANVLPPEHRRSSSRVVFVPTLVLAGLLLLVALGMLFYSKYSEREYLAGLHAEMARVEPKAMRAAALDRETAHLRARAELLDQYRSRARQDLDALNELTQLVSPPAWTSNIDLTRDSARITGEAPQAAPLLKILDSSSLFRNSGFDQDQHSPSGTGEVFQIHTTRVTP
jgi:Tfp pilus assembly protein PilN